LAAIGSPLPERFVVFHVRCDVLGKEVMIWPAFVEAIENTDQGIIVRYECVCGRAGELLTGAQSPAEVSVHVAG
jgi:hypothetical protein